MTRTRGWLAIVAVLAAGLTFDTIKVLNATSGIRDEQTVLKHQQAVLHRLNASTGRVAASANGRSKATVRYLQGKSGLPGVPGKGGVNGAPGPPGGKGPTGARGSVGPAGPQGPAGAGVTPSQVANAVFGYCVTHGSCVGPAGAKGDTGPAGPAGKNGADGKDGAPGADSTVPGPPGATGPPGPAGANGTSPTVTQLSAGDPNCPNGGASITDAAGNTAFVCSG